MTFDTIVVGLGGMGSAVAAQAAQRGLRVLGLERFREGHDLGASSGRSRIIRKAYFEDPAYVPMALRAYELWAQLQERTGIDLLRITGLLMAGPATSPIVAGAKESARRHGLPLELLDAHDLARRFPELRPSADAIGAFEPDGGYLIPEAAIAAHLAVARGAGAQLQFEAPVRSWAVNANGTVALRLESGESYEAARLVACMGPWTAALFADAGIPLTVQRNVQHWFSAVDGRYGEGKLPVFLIDDARDPAPLYGFPDAGFGIKAAFHGWGDRTEADRLERVVTADDIEPVRAALERWMPGSTTRYLDSKACMYSLTPDHHFVIGAHPEMRSVILAGGFSGHGFKFAAVVGEIIADLLTGDRARLDIEFLSPARFIAAR